MTSIYLDHAATTPLGERVLAAMLPYMRQDFGNASSTHSLGRAARDAVEQSRERVAMHLGAEPSEIVFTSGGTEGNNAAIQGVLGRTGRGLVTSGAEHAAVLEPATARAKSGAHVTILSPTKDGNVTPDQVGAALSPDTGLVSLTLVNNEIGTITPIPAISALCRSAGVSLHTDAVQAAKVMALDVDALGVDLMTLSAHKVYGPKGIGALYVRSGVTLDPLMLGGAQERSRRGGTENVPAVVGMAEALDLAQARREEESERLLALRRSMEAQLTDALGDTFVFNTPVTGAAAAPHILSIALKPVNGRPLDGEMLHLNLDMAGVQVSAGAACSSGTLKISHVLRAIGRDDATAQAVIRFSLGKGTTSGHVKEAVARLARITRRMRKQRARCAA